MKVEALNCPNCGAAVRDKAASCAHCRSRLKTMACTSCFGTIFEGNKYCPLCGQKATAPSVLDSDGSRDCPRCQVDMREIVVEDTVLRECEKCEGVWTDISTFQLICEDREKQSAVVSKLDEISGHPKREKVQYLPCPECTHLMNRSNFARVSGVIIDTCKEHGFWFDADELPKIIQFIRSGGMDYSRQKEKVALETERQRLRNERFKASVDRFKDDGRTFKTPSPAVIGIREIIEKLLG